MKEIIYKPAAPSKRFLAFLVEALVSIAYIFSVVGAFDDTYGQDGSTLIAFGTLILIDLALMTRSTTLGKLILNMKVVHRRNGKDLSFFEMLFRESLGKLIALIFFALGFIWIMIDNENRGWHDMVFGTMVVELVPLEVTEKDDHDDDFYVQG